MAVKNSIHSEIYLKPGWNTTQRRKDTRNVYPFDKIYNYILHIIAKVW